MKRNNHLSDQELDMLLNFPEPVNTNLPDDDYQIELNNSQLIALLNKANSLFIEANFEQHNLRFPLYLAHDMPDVISPRLGIPEIYEHATAGQRLWRLDNPTDLELLNSNGETLPFEIINISVSGLLIRDHMLTLNLGERFDGILSGFGIYIPLTGVIVRSKKRKNKSQEWAIRLTLDSHVHEKLQEYIYRQHQDKYPTTDITADVESP